MIRAALALAAIVAFRGAFAAEGGLELLVARYADAAAAEQDVSRAAALRASLKADGSWGDIDYSDKSRSEWPVGAHVRARLRILAADWRRNGSRESLEAAHRALGFWLKHRFGNPNWWWNIIGVPMSLGDAGVMMDGELTDAERRGIIELMTVEEPGHAKTGQNFAWMSENRLSASTSTASSRSSATTASASSSRSRASPRCSRGRASSIRRRSSSSCAGSHRRDTRGYAGRG